MEVADKLKAYIEDNGIKQTYIAEKTGIDVKTLNAILNGYVRLSVDRLEAICKVLKVSPKKFFWLLRGIDRKNQRGF